MTEEKITCSKSFKLEIFVFVLIALMFAVGVGMYVMHFPATVLKMTQLMGADFRQTISYAQSADMTTVHLFLGVFIGYMFVFCTWCMYKCNRIEKRLIKMEEKFNKE